jgi:DNA repair protein RadC
MAQQLRATPVFDAPQSVKDYLALHLQRACAGGLLRALPGRQHRLLRLEDLFFGTLTQTSVYPREVVKRALALNAGAVVLAHNHPSGLAEPSRADEYLTQTLVAALKLVDVRVLDHLVVGQGQVVSMAERGLM